MDNCNGLEELQDKGDAIGVNKKLKEISGIDSKKHTYNIKNDNGDKITCYWMKIYQNRLSCAAK